MEKRGGMTLLPRACAEEMSRSDRGGGAAFSLLANSAKRRRPLCPSGISPASRERRIANSHSSKWLCAVTIAAVLLTPFAAPAQDASEKEIERYRAMISDPMSNPGFLAVDRGEQLWAAVRGAKNASLAICDLGEGPGKLEGAFARLPRFFADAGKVMDLEQRLLWCMQTVQGLDTKDVVARRFSKPGVQSDMEDLIAFIANKSNGMKIEPQLAKPGHRAVGARGTASAHPVHIRPLADARRLADHRHG